MSNFPTKSLHVLPADTFVRTRKSTVYIVHHFRNFLRFTFVDRLLSRTTAENATLLIDLPRFVVIELDVSEL